MSPSTYDAVISPRPAGARCVLPSVAQAQKLWILTRSAGTLQQQMQGFWRVPPAVCPRQCPGSGHRNGVSRVIGIACRRSSEWSAACRLRHVETSPCDHCCSGRPVPVRGRPHLRVSQGWISRLMARYRAEGEAAFEPRSRGPEVEPGGDPAGHGRAGAAAAQAARRGRSGRRRRHHRLAPGPPPRHDAVAGHDQPDPGPGRCHHPGARRSVRRAPTSGSRPSMPNECWQSDFTHYRLTRPDGSPGADTEILTWLDDCSRYALHVTAHVRVTGPIVLATFRKTVARHGVPASTLTDNGMVFTTRFSGGKGGRNHLETRAPRAAHHPEERPAQPPPDPRQGRTLPTDPQEMATRPTSPARHHRRAAGPARRLRRAVQPAPTAPLPAPPRHPGHDLHLAAQGHPDQRPHHRHPRPRPPRQDRQSRQRHPARRRPTTPHRRRANPRPNRRHPARPRPPRHHHQRRHRRDPARPEHRPPPRLPAHRPTTRPHTQEQIARTCESQVRAIPMS